MENQTQQRSRQGRLVGAVGIGTNLLLFIGKLIAGIMSGSVAVMADAFNNLSDAGTSLVTLVGFYLAGQEADEEHPFGHGRLEYLAGLIVALAILLVGVELVGTSFDRIMEPVKTQFSLLSCAVLVAAVAAKLGLWQFDRIMAHKMDSPAVAAAAEDSLCDAAATALVLVSALLGQYFNWQVDGWAGLLVAMFIFRAGWQAVRETADPLLGRAMSGALARDIDALALDHPYILGIHDLVYHDYGPGRAMMSFHAEVPADADLLAVHDVIDHIEREMKQRHGIVTVIHMDPICRDERTLAVRGRVEELVRKIDPEMTVHDFRMTAGPMHTNLIFDVVVPFGCKRSDGELRRILSESVKELGEEYYAVVDIDRPFVTDTQSR